MSEDLHDIDDLFRKALNENNETASPDVWNQIEKSLDKSKVISISKKYNKLKWAVAVLALFCLSMVVYSLYIKDQNRELVKQNKESRKHNQSNTQPAIGNIDSSNISANDVNVQKKTGAPSVTAKSNDNNLQKPGTKNITDTQRTVNTTDSEESQTFTLHQQTKIRTGTEHDTNLKNKANSPGNNITANEINRKNKMFATGITTNTLQKTSNIRGTVKRVYLPAEATGNYKADGDIVKEKSIKTTDILPGLKNDLSAIQTPLYLQPDKETIAYIKKNAEKKSLIVKRDNPIQRHRSPLSITAFFSPDIISTKTENDHPRFREEERDEIDKDESVKFSSTIGLFFNYSINRNWKIESGITYSSRKIDIEPKTVYARPNNNSRDINYRLNCSAGYSYINVSAYPMPASGDSIHVLSSRNTLDYIGIPVDIRYVATLKKWNFIPSAGAAFNFLSKGQIETTIPVSSGAETKTTNKVQGLKPFYLSGLVGAAAQYNINSSFALSFEPTVRFALSSINTEVPVRTNLNSLGFKAGVVLKFSR